MMGQMQNGAPMQGGAGKGGIQQPMNGGGKGGMAKNPGPGVALDSGYGNFSGATPNMGQFADLRQQFNQMPAPPVQMPSPQQLGVNPQQLNQSLQGLNLGGLPQYGGHGFGRPVPGPRPGLDISSFGNINQTGPALGGGLLKVLYGGNR